MQVETACINRRKHSDARTGHEVDRLKVPEGSGQETRASLEMNFIESAPIRTFAENERSGHAEELVTKDAVCFGLRLGLRAPLSPMVPMPMISSSVPASFSLEVGIDEKRCATGYLMDREPTWR